MHSQRSSHDVERIQDQISKSFENYRKTNGSKKYPDRLKSLCCRGLSAGLSFNQVAEVAGITDWTVRRWYSENSAKIEERPLKPAVQVLEVGEPKLRDRSPALIIGAGGLRIEIFQEGA